MKRLMIVSLLAIVSFWTSSILLHAETSQTDSMSQVQLCFGGVTNAVFEFEQPSEFTVDMADGPQAITKEYINIGGVLLDFKVSSSTNVPITKVMIIYGGFREEVEIIDTFDGTYQVHVPVIQSNSTQMIYIVAYSE